MSWVIGFGVGLMIEVLAKYKNIVFLTDDLAHTAPPLGDMFWGKVDDRRACKVPGRMGFETDDLAHTDSFQFVTNINSNTHNNTNTHAHAHTHTHTHTRAHTHTQHTQYGHTCFNAYHNGSWQMFEEQGWQHPEVFPGGPPPQY